MTLGFLSPALFPISTLNGRLAPSMQHRGEDQQEQPNNNR